MVSVDPGGNVNQVELMLRPRDVHDNFLGPDYGQYFKAYVSGSSQALTSSRDLLDGRYQYLMSIPTGSNPHISDGSATVSWGLV